MMDRQPSNFDYAASARRIAAAYRRKPEGRIPIMPPIPWDPFQDADSGVFGDWRDDRDFRSLARLVSMHCDAWPSRGAVGYPKVFSRISYQRFLEAPDEYIEELPAEKLSDTRTRHTFVLHTPKGCLKWIYGEDAGILTQWDVHRPIQSAEDVEKMLSVPYKFTPPASAGYEAFRIKRAEMGCNATGGGGVNSMVAMLCGMMEYELLLEWVLTEPSLIKLLADEWLKRNVEKVEFLLSQRVGPYWHFNGVERASPPMMGPKQWDALVVPYDGEIMRLIKARDPDARIHVHCHGKVRTLLDSFVEMGVDSTDPVEPYPQGDMDFGEVKREYADKLTFFGNIEFLDMETRTPDEIESLVKHAIEDGGKNNVVLMASAGPHEKPTPKFMANAARYIEAGLKYGAV